MSYFWLWYYLYRSITNRYTSANHRSEFFALGNQLLLTPSTIISRNAAQVAKLNQTTEKQQKLDRAVGLSSHSPKYLTETKKQGFIVSLHSLGGFHSWPLGSVCLRITILGA